MDGVELATKIKELNISFVAVDEVSGEALAEELIKLAESESERMRYGKAGRHYYESYLSNSQALDSFYKFIQEL